MDKETITAVLAIWGAVLSSVTLGWNFIRDINQRGRLRVSCYIGKLVGGSVGVDPNSYLVWNITNIGKEPVLLTHVGGATAKEGFMLTTHQPLPKMLQPGEYVLEYSDELSVLGPELKHLWAIDSLGRNFKAPRRQLKELKKKYASGKYAKKGNNS